MIASVYVMLLRELSDRVILRWKLPVPVPLLLLVKRPSWVVVKSTDRRFYNYFHVHISWLDCIFCSIYESFQCLYIVHCCSSWYLSNSLPQMLFSDCDHHRWTVMRTNEDVIVSCSISQYVLSICIIKDFSVFGFLSRSNVCSSMLSLWIWMIDLCHWNAWRHFHVRTP